MGKEDEILTQLAILRTAVVGIDGTDDRGISGEVKLIREKMSSVGREVAEHESRINRLEDRCKRFHAAIGKPVSRTRYASFLGSLGIFLAAGIYELGRLLGWWN